MSAAGKVAIALVVAGGVGGVAYVMYRRKMRGAVAGAASTSTGAGGGGGGGPVDVTYPPFNASGAGYGPAVAPIVDSWSSSIASVGAYVAPAAPFAPPPPPGAPPAPLPPPPPPVPVTIVGATLNGAGLPTQTTLYVPPGATDAQVLSKAADLAAIMATGLPPAGFIRDDDYTTPDPPATLPTARRGRAHF